MNDTQPAAETTEAAQAPADPGAPQVHGVAAEAAQEAALASMEPAALDAVARGMSQAVGVSGVDSPWRRASLACALLNLDLSPVDALDHARAWNAWIMEPESEAVRHARLDLAQAATTRAPTCRFNPATAAELADIAAWCAESAAA